MNRYRVADLEVEGTPVVWTMAAGDEVEGYLAITARGRRIYRVYVDSPRRRQSQDLPRFAEPTWWRPLFSDRWPEPLPDPVTIVLQPTYDASVRPEPSPPDPEALGEPDGWPIPGLHLGLGRPRSRDEAEARILRAIRTAEMFERMGDRPGNGPLWPPALMFKARMVEKALRNSRSGTLGFLRPEDYEQIHVDRSDLRALPDVWIPTRRDIGDLENNVMLWLRGLERNTLHVVHMRAARPQYSWRAIAEYFVKSDRIIKVWYRDAIDHVWKRAKA